MQINGIQIDVWAFIVKYPENFVNKSLPNAFNILKIQNDLLESIKTC